MEVKMSLFDIVYLLCSIRHELDGGVK